MNNTKLKQCTICMISKSTDDFYKNKSNSIDGLSPYCKECTKKKSQQWQKANRDKFLQTLSKYNRKPNRKQAIKQSTRNYLEEGYYQEYRKSNIEKYKEYNRIRAHKKHKISKKDWNKCKEYFELKCAYCGLSLEEQRKQYRQDFHKEHVDFKGSPHIENCIPSCKICNSEKHTSKLEDWYNEDNPKFNIDNLQKIYKWINEDCYNIS